MLEDYDAPRALLLFPPCGPFFLPTKLTLTQLFFPTSQPLSSSFIVRCLCLLLALSAHPLTDALSPAHHLHTSTNVSIHSLCSHLDWPQSQSPAESWIINSWRRHSQGSINGKLCSHCCSIVLLSSPTRTHPLLYCIRTLQNELISLCSKLDAMV
jgi:hypothetical protein